MRGSQEESNIDDREEKEDIDYPKERHLQDINDYRTRDLRLDPRSSLYQPHHNANPALHIFGDPAEKPNPLAGNPQLRNRMVQQLFEDSDNDDLDVGEYEGLDVINAGNAG
jgi:hypothetical protein